MQDKYNNRWPMSGTWSTLGTLKPAYYNIFFYFLQSWMCHCHIISQLPQFHSSTLTLTANSKISLLKILLITWFARKNSWAQTWQSVQQKLMVLNFVQYTWDGTPYKQSLKMTLNLTYTITLAWYNVLYCLGVNVREMWDACL